MAQTLTIQKRHFMIPESGDSCELWRTYFTQLKKTVGQENAKMIWLITWNKNGSSTCTTNAGFNAFLKKNQIDVSSASTRIIADTSQIGSNIFGLGKNITKIASLGAPILFGSLLIGILVLLYNTVKKADLGDAAAVFPQGRALKLLGATKLLKR